MSLQAYRASLLWFDPEAHYEEDGLLVVGPNAQGRQVVQAIGSWRALSPSYCRQPVEQLPGRLIAPGFVDMHVHFPQTNVIGSPAAGLLPWLENYTFPEEQRFESQAYSDEAAGFFLDELLRNGVTTALAFATSHTTSVNALFSQAQARHLRLITGLCLMDRHAPQALLTARYTNAAIHMRWNANTRPENPALRTKIGPMHCSVTETTAASKAARASRSVPGRSPATVVALSASPSCRGRLSYRHRCTTRAQSPPKGGRSAA